MTTPTNSSDIGSKSVDEQSIEMRARELIEKWRRAAVEHGLLHSKQVGYEVSFEDSGKSDAYDNCADELEAALRSAEQPSKLEGTKHPDDIAVELFAEALKAKLEYSRINRGRAGWSDKSDCTQQHLSSLLRAHVEKGDPVDVANFACFLWNRQERIAEQPSAPEPVACDPAAVERALTYLAFQEDGAQWPDAYSEEEQASERANMRGALAAANATEGPQAYCRACQNAGMRNCAHFDECTGATCITCHRPLNTPDAPPAPRESGERGESEQMDIVTDLVHSANVDGYTDEQAGFILSIAERVEHLELTSPHEPTAFVNDGNSEAQYVEDGRNLNCPTCGGSGHVDDAKPREHDDRIDAAIREYGEMCVHGNADDQAEALADVYSILSMASSPSVESALPSANLAFEGGAEASTTTPREAAHPDDAAVDRFAAALKAKLAEARAKGRGGWQTDEPGMQQRLSDMLREHVAKGDPRDVANFCMFLHQRGEAILPAREAAQEPARPWRPIAELPDSDDLYWFLRGDVIDGPRVPQFGGFDADEWDYFAPCEAPPTNPAPQQRASAVESAMASIPRDELERTIKVLQYASHPSPSPHAAALAEFLAAPDKRASAPLRPVTVGDARRFIAEYDASFGEATREEATMIALAFFCERLAGERAG